MMRLESMAVADVDMVMKEFHGLMSARSAICTEEQRNGLISYRGRFTRATSSTRRRMYRIHPQMPTIVPKAIAIARPTF